jgi:hypothetical protein
VLPEKLDCILTKRAAKANIYESASTAECHQLISESTVISGHTRHLHLRSYKTSTSQAIRDLSPASVASSLDGPSPLSGSVQSSVKNNCTGLDWEFRVLHWTDAVRTSPVLTIYVIPD